MILSRPRLGSFGAGAAILCLVLTTASSSPTNANPPARAMRAFGAPVQRTAAAVARRGTQGRHRSFTVTPTGCTSDYGTASSYFVGINDSNYADAYDSAVLGGFGNEACDEASAIGGGDYNVIGDSGNASYSFLGAGGSNAVTGGSAFLGAGSNNETAGGDAFVGAGFDGTAFGNGSFVGAGGFEFEQEQNVAGAGNVADGADSFVGAGDINHISSTGIGSFIGAGGSSQAESNASVSNSISGQDAFIGAGDNNTVSAQEAFLGAGTGGNLSGEYSAIAGGYADHVSGVSSFAGAGGYNVVSGQDAFAGAGNANTASGEGSFAGAGGTAGSSTGNKASGQDSFAGAGDENTASDTDSASVAGYDNTVSGNSAFAGAGEYNTAGGSLAFVGAGYGNSASGLGSFVGAGGGTSGGSTVTGADSFVGAGDKNSIAATQSFIGGGGSNSIEKAAPYSVLTGGYGNTLSGEYAAIGGGYGNEATGEYATVAGGDGNTAAGAFSFAGGYHADAVNSGSFVWSDHMGSTTVKDKAQNQFVVRASGGVFFYSNPTLTSGVSLPTGSGAWANLSDRNAKTNIVPLDDASVLAKVASLPVSTWQYKTERGVRHLGPMAQDFYAAFGVGEDDRHITSIDEDGVALAAIKALYSENGRLQRANVALRSQFERQNAEKGASIRVLADKVRRLDADVAALLASDSRRASSRRFAATAVSSTRAERAPIRALGEPSFRARS
jgi:hypothetical protein